MYHIIYIFIVLVLFSFFDKKIFSHLAFLLLAIMFSGRNDLILDTETYLLHYTEPYTSWVSDTTEMGFVMTNIFFGHILSVDFSIYLFVLSFVMMEIWYYTSRKLFPYESMGLLFLLFMSYNGFFYYGVTLRNALSLMICYVALMVFIISKSRLRIIYYTLLIFLSMLYHRTSFFFLILPILDYLKISRRGLRIWLFADVLFLIFGGVSFLFGFSQLFMNVGGLDKYEQDFDMYNESSMFSLWFIMNIIVSLFLVYGRRYVVEDCLHRYDFFLKMVLLGLSINCIGWQMSIIQRLAGSLYFFNFIPLYIIIFKSSLFKEERKKKFVTICISLFCFIVLLYCQSFLLFY